MMNTKILSAAGVAGTLLLLAGGTVAVLGARPPSDREKFEKLISQGNYKDAYEGFRALALDSKDDPLHVGSDLRRAISCLVQLGRLDEIDKFREAVIEAHKDNWRLIEAAAESYLDDGDHNGFIVAGQFRRSRQGFDGGKYVSAAEHDRARALQLLVLGLDLVRRDPDRASAGRYDLTLARALLAGRADAESWRLQALTPLDVLPDYEENAWGGWGGSQSSAPVQPDGTPVYYHVPQSFQAARNDGERWRWALAQAALADAGLLNSARMELANFLHGQFGTETAAGMNSPGEQDDGPAEPTDPRGLETLKDSETIARLATGVKRFTLPDEFNPIKIYQQVADEPQTGQGEEALTQLGSIFENRRQYDRAAEILRRNIDRYRDPKGWKALRLDQILGAWGQFEPMMTRPAGKGAEVDFVYRNGRLVHFEAQEVLVEKLLADVKEYLQSRPPQLAWQKIDLNQVGYRLVTGNQRQYIGRLAARWDLELKPRAGHLDRRITVSTPLQKAGAYLLTARMEGGHTSHIVVWLDDTVIVQKNVAENAYYFVADSRTGQPVPGATVDIFGWRMLNVLDRKEFRVETRKKTLQTDAEGQAQMPGKELLDQWAEYQWLCTARTAEGRFAHLGFSRIWLGGNYQPDRQPPKVQMITDRPVYRPGQPVRFKFWVARSRYEQPDASEFANTTFDVEIHNPKGEKVLTKEYKADAFGGFDDTFELPSDAALGVYQVVIPNLGGGSFRVEEYKKPEFEVTVDAPSNPVMLGEKVAATIKAKYYFGAAVAQAKVRYKVTRTAADDRWFPATPWDWLFGTGYWWFGGSYSWYPGWARWGMAPPIRWWWGVPQGLPEVVADAEVAIRPDGTVPVEIDTAVAKAAHPSENQRYEIIAEVTDQSRRTIVGTGTVLVARKPFSVYTWVGRGHYRTGDTIEAGIRAQTLDRKPVAGKGTLKLLSVTYDREGKPVETPVEQWDVALNAEGQAGQTIKASTPGQYRLSCTIDDGQGHAIEGGYLFVIVGQGFDGTSFRFNDLEIVPDRKQYQPGDTLRLLINTNRIGSTVLLFLRPTNGVCTPPKVLHLRGKSTVEEIGIAQRDMPNIFIEALTVSGGKVHNEAREIAVPPESRMVDVKVEASQPTYKPGQKAKLKLKLTGPDGKPFQGSTVLTVYDKATEYISGGSNVGAIKEAFWNWKRSHQPQTQSSLDRPSVNLVTQNERAMEELGVFGGVPAGEEKLGEPGIIDPMPPIRGHARARGGFGGIGGGMGGMERGASSGYMLAAAPMAPAGREMTRRMSMSGEFDKSKGSDVDFERLQSSQPVQPVVRSNFADTAFWAAALSTAADGTAEVDFALPESLTTWKVRTWTLGPGTRVGQADTEVITTKDLLVRLQAPRFFVQKDEVVLSANVHNRLKTKKSVQVELETEGSVLNLLDSPVQTVEVDSGGERRVDWRVAVTHEGQAVVRMKALTDEESDAAQMTFPAYVHGMLKQEAVAGSIRPDQKKAEVALRVPAERRPDQTRLEVRYSPTLAGAMVDALPYLVDYPYGCTEQTLNRFLPTVIAQKVLINMGVDLKAIRDKQTNLNAQELGDAKERARGWKRYKRDPVFDPAEVARMARAGIERLSDMQLSDGGWGWFSGFGEYAFPHTTAQVVHGLQVARRNDLALPEGMLERGVAWLAAYQAKQVQLLHNGISEVKPYKKSAEDVDALVFMALTDADVRNDAMLGFLDRDRTRLSVYAKALFGLALEKLGEKDKLALVLQNIRQYVVEDAENQTAYLKLPNEGYWWWWYGSEIETDAFYLKLLARTEPRGDLAPRLVKYVLNNRKHGTYWNSTRDTASCIESLADYLKASGEDRPDMTVAVSLDGKTRKEVRITPADLFRFDNALVLEGGDLATGRHTVTLTRQGTGPLYFNAYLTNFTLEDPITRSGLEIKVDRKAYRLIRDDKTANTAGVHGEVVGARVEKYRREPLTDGATLKSGDLVEVELEIESKNDYEYLVFEDYKAAGFEPVEVRSGYNGNDLGAFVEFRDDRVAFFARTLARGKHSVSYRLRAEIPGKFHALPARALAMYSPELKANSDEIQLRIEDQPGR
jgi:uncharacterized protein YfaS (alpha-2-macroglobulin family)